MHFCVTTGAPVAIYEVIKKLYFNGEKFFYKTF